MSEQSKVSLAFQVICALGVAAVLAICVVLPAEYGYDPLSTGKALGLTSLAGQEEQTSNGSYVLSQEQKQLRQDDIEFLLSPGQGLELKTKLLKGQVLVYEWSTDGALLEVDFHGDTDAVAKGYVSHRLANDTYRGAGVFEAPFEGPHGWYWKNNTQEPVKINLQVSGFHSPFYMP